MRQTVLAKIAMVGDAGPDSIATHWWSGTLDVVRAIVLVLQGWKVLGLLAGAGRMDSAAVQ